MSIWPSIKKALNSTVGPNVKPLDTLFNEAIEPISESLMIPKFTKAIIASGSFTIPKDGTYKIIACGSGGTMGHGGGGCAIDQRDYAVGDVLTLTVSGAASAVCLPRGLSITANGTTGTVGATASGGNVGNHTGGTCSATTSLRDSNGCGACGYGNSSVEVANGGNGGIIGGDGYPQAVAGSGGTGGIIGGDGGMGGSVNYGAVFKGGYGGVFGGRGGDGLAGHSSYTSKGGDGGDGGFVGGAGGVGGAYSTTIRQPGGNGGNGVVLGGMGGNATAGGTGGVGGSIVVAAGSTKKLFTGSQPNLNVGGNGAYNGMYWAIPFKEVFKWTKGNAIIFIEEM